MGKGVLIISETEMSLWKKGFEHKTIHCYTTSLFSSSTAELFFFFGKFSFVSLYKRAVKVGVGKIDGGIVLVK